MEAAPMTNPSNPTPSQRQARAFLKHLDANTKQFQFRTFDDKPKRGRLTSKGGRIMFDPNSSNFSFQRKLTAGVSVWLSAQVYDWISSKSGGVE